MKFGSNLAIKSSYSHCKLILVAGMKFGLNLAIRASYNCWQHFLAVGSSQIWFSIIGSQIWQLDAFTKTRVKYRMSLDLQKFKSSRWLQEEKALKNCLNNCKFYKKKHWYIVKKSTIFLAPTLPDVCVASCLIFSSVFCWYINDFFQFSLDIYLTDYR